MKIDFSPNKVTPLSKALAMLLFIALPFIGFWIGNKDGLQTLNNDYTLATSMEMPEAEVNEVVLAVETRANISSPKEVGKLANSLSFNEQGYDRVSGCSDSILNDFADNAIVYVPDANIYLSFAGGHANFLVPEIGLGRGGDLSAREAGHFQKQSTLTLEYDDAGRPMIVCLNNLTGKGSDKIMAVVRYWGGNNKNSSNYLVRFDDGNVKYAEHSATKNFVFVGVLDYDNSYSNSLSSANLVGIEGADVDEVNSVFNNYYEAVNIFLQENGSRRVEKVTAGMVD